MSPGPPKRAQTPHLVIDSQTWATAYRKYFRLWINLAKTTGISDDEAKDVLHGVISSIVEDPSKEFESLEHLRNYVAKAVLHRAVQARKNGDRRERWSEETELKFRLSPEIAEGEEERRIAALKEGIERLGRNEYEIIKLRFYFGLTFREINEKLNVPISTLKSREDAAIKKIHNYLRKKGF